MSCLKATDFSLPSCVRIDKHAEMRVAYLLLQLYYAWQGSDWKADREAADVALAYPIQRMRAAEISEMKRFADTLSKYKRCIVSGYILGINTSKAARTNADIKAMKRNLGVCRHSRSQGSVSCSPSDPRQPSRGFYRKAALDRARQGGISSQAQA